MTTRLRSAVHVAAFAVGVTLGVLDGLRHAPSKPGVELAMLPDEVTGAGYLPLFPEAAVSPRFAAERVPYLGALCSRCWAWPTFHQARETWECPSCSAFAKDEAVMRLSPRLS